MDEASQGSYEPRRLFVDEVVLGKVLDDDSRRQEEIPIGFYQSGIYGMAEGVRLEPLCRVKTCYSGRTLVLAEVV